MRILLAHNSLYYPSHGGGDKSNRLLMEALAGLGHRVRVMSRLESFGDVPQERFLEELNERGSTVYRVADGMVSFRRNGVEVVTVTANPRLRACFARQVEEFDPEVILCSTDDPGALLLEVALRDLRARVVYLVRATVAVPFGPDASFQNPAKTEMIGRVDSIIGVSEYVAEYVRKWSGFPAIHVPISLLEDGDYSDVGRFDNEFVLMVNPCAVKGISIFVGLAGAMPDVRFAAVPTWGTNRDDLALLREHANITVFEPVDDIMDLLRRSRAVLVPSVWAEARSRMVVEAMIRGVPVLASDVGGLHEAKLGIEYLLPVNPITSYQARVDGNMVPVADVPPQDIGPWQAALRRLLTDREHYEDLSRRSRAAALEYAKLLHAGWLDAHLRELIAKPKRNESAAVIEVSGVEKLSDAKRQLLALRMKQKAKGDWFPVFPDAPFTLFCFPYAGGGTAMFQPLRAALDGVVPVRLPGREARAKEAAFTEMGDLIAALADAITPHVERRYALYGHSMGAGVAFELARELRRRCLRMPEALIVVAARAPQLRTSVGPEPDDAQLLDQLARLGANMDVARGLLEVLRADTRLYRNYVYQAGAPLDLPIYAFGGVDDVSLDEASIDAWGEQTTQSFTLRMLPGGHFLKDASAILRTLEEVGCPRSTI